MDLESKSTEKIREIFAKTVLAKRITRLWRRTVAKRTNGYVICHGNAGVGEDGDHPTTTIYNDHLNIFYEWDHFQFKNKGCDAVLSYPYSLCTWKTKLARLKKDKQKFVDKSFPPDDSSLFHDPSYPKQKMLKEHAKKWIRISEMFHRERVFKFTFRDDNQMDLCGFSVESPQEFYTAEHFAEAKAADAAYKKALDVCLAAVSHKPNEAEFFSAVSGACKIVVKDSPTLFFSNITEHKITCTRGHSAYVPQNLICVLAKCLFKPRPQLFERENDDKFFVEPGDIIQGVLGDCYVLGALSVLAADEELLFRCFPDANPEETSLQLREQQFNEEGLYAVAFYKNRQRRIVVIDDYIPVNAAGQPVFCRPPTNSFEIWTMLAEKAYAKLHGSYEALEGGQEKTALQELTGGLPLAYHISGEHMEAKWKGKQGEELLWNFLKDDLFNPSEGARSLVGCSAMVSADPEKERELERSGIIANHAYGILQVRELQFDGSAYRLIQIRNPWGNEVEWSGNWSDKDARWNQVDMITKEEMKFSNKTDGTFWMELSDFMGHFSEIEVCRLLNQSPNWTHHHVNGEWTSVNAGGHTNLEICPQFQLVLVKDTKLYVELRQPSRRALGEGNTFKEAICPIVVKNCKTGTRQQPTVKNIAGSDKSSSVSFERAQSSVIELDLKACEGPFNIIAAIYDDHTHTAEFQSEFYLDVYTKDGCELCNTGEGRHTHSELLPIKEFGLPEAPAWHHASPPPRPPPKKQKPDSVPISFGSLILLIIGVVVCTATMHLLIS